MTNQIIKEGTKLAAKAAPYAGMLAVETAKLAGGVACIIIGVNAGYRIGAGALHVSKKVKESCAVVKDIAIITCSEVGGKIAGCMKTASSKMKKIVTPNE